VEGLGEIKLFEVYKNKKVLVTGHTGFKGSWLSLWLLKLGAQVTGYALDPKTEKDMYVLSDLESKISDNRADIRNYDKIKKVIDDEKPEIIFHLAAQPLVLESYENPHYTIETNTQGTVNVLEAFRQSATAKILILITTDKVYENNEWIWGYRENERLGGKDPYSASKAAAEILISSYQKSFFDKNSSKLIASVRAGNVIGGGDWAENRIVPDCIKAIENVEKIIIRNSSATRPWQHVLEPLGGYLLLGEKLLEEKSKFQGAWNFGPFSENNKNVECLVKEVVKHFGKGEYKINQNPNAPIESNFLSLDITKAVQKLKWKPIFNFEDTIKYTVSWYKSYMEGNIYQFSINQIAEYEKLWKLRNEN